MPLAAPPREATQQTPSVPTCLRLLGSHGPTGLPFSPGDATAGSEIELQGVVLGDASHVDLPQQIRASTFYANAARRAATGDTSTAAIHGIRRYLDENTHGVWENSWVVFPQRALNPLALRVLRDDLQADKSRPDGPRRSDAGRFGVVRSGEPWARVPVSYLLKLALADAVCPSTCPHDVVRRTGLRLLDRFISDNTSPEVLSLHVCALRPADGSGRALAREMTRRFLLTQLLAAYANAKLGLADRGQRAFAYLSPHPPTRQRDLNACISDAFYRELFVNPCLSGWERGEDKQQYMALCHQVLSRSQLNAVAKLREAGLIPSGLVVLPNPSSVSLANNGTHISLGSRLLTARLAEWGNGFGPAHEKVAGDLAIKIMEHFLPLFVGTYSASPYRLAFADFHPEVALGFLPHELDFTHLRMLWRRWKGKARIHVCGGSLTPFGPRDLDHLLSRALRLRGDLVPDYRLVDYPVALLSSPSSPALDGSPGSDERLKADLESMGVFDTRLSLYLPVRPRLRARHGFSGHEARYYSVFPSLVDDVRRAADLQLLVAALAWRYVAAGDYTHRSIPDSPVVESERRQAFFAAALGIPTIYVRCDTPSQLLAQIAQRTESVRVSRRYRGYWRVPLDEYRATLLRLLRTEAVGLAQDLGLGDLLEDLDERLRSPGAAASGRLVEGILRSAGSSSPWRLSAAEFNQAAERYYRDELRLQHTREALDLLPTDFTVAAQEVATSGLVGLARLLPDAAALTALRQEAEAGLRQGVVAPATALRLIHLVLLAEWADARRSGTDIGLGA